MLGCATGLFTHQYTIRYHDSMRETAAAIVKEARSAAGLSQRALGIRAGLPQSAVSFYESGQKEPSIPVLSRLVAAAGFTLTMKLEPSSARAPEPFTGPVGRKVQRRRSELRDLLAEKGFEKPQVFGSTARGEDRADSDLDLLVDVPTGIGLFGLIALQREAEQLVGVPVDLVDRAGLKPGVSAEIVNDLVSL
jgi:predicted nucleotidyltransferase/DNA-binding XRE family transcriptional regulator